MGFLGRPPRPLLPGTSEHRTSAIWLPVAKVKLCDWCWALLGCPDVTCGLGALLSPSRLPLGVREQEEGAKGLRV